MSASLGTGVYWAGAVGIADYAQLQRSTGFEPDVATVRFLGAQFGDWICQLDPERLQPTRDGVPALAAKLRELVPFRAPRADEAVPFRADFVLAEQVEDELRSVVAANMSLAEVRVVDTHDPCLIEIVLVDVRRWWRGYGEVTRDFNIPRLGGWDWASLLSGKPWPLRALFAWLLKRLPGAPFLEDFPEDLGDEKSREIRCYGARPVEVLEQLVADYDLALALNLDGSVSVYRRGEGSIGYATDSLGGDNQPVTWDPAPGGLGEWEAECVANRWLRTRNDRPDSVVVVGSRKVWTVAIDYWIPVLILPTDDAGGTRILDVTRENLARLLTDTPADMPAPPLTVDTIDMLLRLPLRGSEWQEKIAHLTEEITRVLREQLFRCYRLPSQYRRLLPLLRRAELMPDGSRAPIVVEAFGWEPRKGLAAETAELSDARPPGERLLAELAQQVAALEAQIRDLKELDDVELFAYAYGAVTGKGMKYTPVDPKWVALNIATGGVLAIFLGKSVETEKGEITTTEVAESLYRQSVGRFAELCHLTDPNPRPALLEQAEKELTAARLEFTRALEQVDPRYALQLKIIELEKKIYMTEFLGTATATAERKLLAGVQEDVRKEFGDRTDLTQTEQRERETLRTRIAELERTIGFKETPLPRDDAAHMQLDRLRAEERALAAEGEAAQAPVEVLMHANHERRPVHFRVVDAEEGIIEVLGDTAPGWLENPFVEDEAATRFSPLPVRVLFGTANEADRSRPTSLEPESENDWFRDRSWRNYLHQEQSGAAFATVGHCLPAAQGDSQTRYSFTREDPETGEAELDPIDFPYLIQAEHLQVLTGLPTVELPGGPTNATAVLAEARALAAAVLTQPEFREAGTIELAHPHPVNPNGQITAVQWTLQPGGAGVNTLLSFDHEVEPLPELAHTRRIAGRSRIQFGLDSKARL